MKVCWGCHGFELGMGFVDFRVADELNFRVGRFNPTFGEFQLRHDVANHRTSDKPLPYDMGRMLHLFEFNRSVLPIPYVDNGLEVSGSHFFGTAVQLDYAAHVVTELRTPDAAPYDVDFIASRAAYYVDNNSVPSVGGRVGLTFRLAERVDLASAARCSTGPTTPTGGSPTRCSGQTPSCVSGGRTCARSTSSAAPRWQHRARAASSTRSARSPSAACRIRSSW